MHMHEQSITNTCISARTHAHAHTLMRNRTYSVYYKHVCTHARAGTRHSDLRSTLHTDTLAARPRHPLPERCALSADVHSSSSSSSGGLAAGLEAASASLAGGCWPPRCRWERGAEHERAGLARASLACSAGAPLWG